MASIATFPNEILYKILHEVAGDDRIKIDSGDARPMYSGTESDPWTNSSLYSVSVVCRRWSKVASDLPDTNGGNQLTGVPYAPVKATKLVTPNGVAAGGGFQPVDAP
ncbi:hypothetical protein PM082_013799 [Marasmius tenuissimus]|nr:hypothetical protein PM082_013799 [Marasmius tenuissimus]